MSEIDDVVDRMDAKFRSANSVPVQRAPITANEWAIIREAIKGDSDESPSSD